jgi:hypothetical protein
MSGREQEIIMIPALICVVNAISKIDDTNIKAITSVIIVLQLITHICMTIQPFPCNPNEGKICNKFALGSGIFMFLSFSKVVFFSKKIDKSTILSLFISLYSISSHIVHIPAKDLLKNRDYLITSTLIMISIYFI